MIDGIHHWPLFISAGLLLNLTPGADMALVANRSAGGGWRAGAAAALGVGAGCFVHIAAAALGVAALLASAPLAFALLRWVGAAWLVWLGWGLLRGRGQAHADAHDATATAGAGPAAAGPAGARTEAAANGRRTAASAVWPRVFAQGFFTNALNPKVALFFLAFVPQFIAPQASHKGLAFVLLGLVFVVNGTLVNLAVAAAVAGLSARWRADARWQRLGRWFNRGVGAVFIGLGLRLALARATP